MGITFRVFDVLTEQAARAYSPFCMERIAILDRDGTFIWEPEKPEGVDPRETFPLNSEEEVAFMDGAIPGMQELKGKGYLLVMATNQTHLGTPKHPKEIFDAVMKKIENELSKEGIRFSFVMVCPHGPDEGCQCRKPAIGGMKDFFEKHPDVDLKNSLMFGDRDTDRQFAENLGVRFVKINTNERFAVPSDI